MKIYFKKSNDEDHSELKHSDDTEDILANEKEINNLLVSLSSLVFCTYCQKEGVGNQE